MASYVLRLKRSVPANWIALAHQSSPSRLIVSSHWMAAAAVNWSEPTK
jgi:hypothetical protein